MTSDCLLLLPRAGVPIEALYIAAAVVRREAWRFNYGRKITPDRLKVFPMPKDDVLFARVRASIESSREVENLALSNAADDLDVALARERLAENVFVRGAELERQLAQLESWW